MDKKYKGKMIKGLAYIVVGMFMLLSSAPLAWSVGERAGGVRTGGGTGGTSEDQLEHGPPIGASGALEGTASSDAFNEIGQLSTAFFGAAPAPPQLTENQGSQLDWQLYYNGAGGIPDVEEEQRSFVNETVNSSPSLFVFSGMSSWPGASYTGTTVENGFDGRLYHFLSTAEVVSPGTFHLSDTSTFNGTKGFFNDGGSLSFEGPWLVDVGSNFSWFGFVVNEGFLNSATTEAGIKLDSSNLNFSGGGFFSTNNMAVLSGSLAWIKDTNFTNAADILLVADGGNITSTSKDDLFYFMGGNVDASNGFVIQGTGSEVNTQGRLAYFDNTNVNIDFDGLIIDRGKLITDKAAFGITGGILNFGGSIVNLQGPFVLPGDPITVTPFQGNSPSGPAFEAKGGADISIGRNAVTVDNALWEAMKLAIVGAVGDPQTKITTENSFVQANNSKIEFFQPTYLTNALIKVNQGDFLTMNGGEMIFHQDFLNMNNAEIQVFNGFLINAQNGANLDIKGILARGTGGVNTIVVNNTAPVTGIQNGIPFTRDPTATVQIGVNPVQGVNLNVTGSAINAGFNSSVKINTP